MIAFFFWAFSPKFYDFCHILVVDAVYLLASFKQVQFYPKQNKATQYTNYLKYLD